MEGRSAGRILSQGLTQDSDMTISYTHGAHFLENMHLQFIPNRFSSHDASGQVHQLGTQSAPLPQ